MSAIPLVLLHGWGAHAGVWGEVIARMALGHAVTAPDFPADETAAFDTACTIDHVIDELAAQAPEQCVVAGWSLGGQMALAWARRHPQQVAKLILVSTTPRFVAAPDWSHGMDGTAFSGFAGAVSANPAEALRRFLLLETQGDAQAREVARKLEAALATRPVADRSVLMHTLDWLRDTDLRATLSAIRQPALVVHGDRDRITPPAAGEYLARQLPDAHLEWMPGAAHAPFVSDPDGFSRRVAAFCHA